MSNTSSIAKIYTEILKSLFLKLIPEYEIELDSIIECIPVSGRDLGIVGDDYALLRGPEIMLTCKYGKGVGQVFTVAPRNYRGSIRNIIERDLTSIAWSSLFHAVLNAILNHLGLIDRTLHCSKNEPLLCGYKMTHYLYSEHGITRILHIGYQPGHVEELYTIYRDNLLVTDLRSDTVWNRKRGILIIDGNLNKYFIQHSDVVLLTASALVNNTGWEIVEYARLYYKPVIIYGVSATGAVYLLRENKILDIRLYCPYARKP
ncbi:MAG: DUF364 domain-containing protein [Thermoprotei archaeon]